MFQPSSLFSRQLWLQPLDTPCHFCLLLPVHFCFTSSLCDKLPTSFKTLAVLRNGPNSLALIPLASKFYVPSCSILVSLAIASTNGFEQKWLHEISKVGLEKSCSFLWFSWNLCSWQAIFWDAPAETYELTCEKSNADKKAMCTCSCPQSKASSTCKPSQSIPDMWVKKSLGECSPHWLWAHPESLVSS